MSKIRILLVPAILLIVALTAGTAFGAAADTQPGTASASLVAPAPACHANASMLAVPTLLPLAQQLSSSEPLLKTNMCGSCSDAVCQGVGVNFVCKIVGTQRYHCINALENFCSDNTAQCECELTGGN